MKSLEFMLLLQKYYLAFTASFNAFPALTAGVFPAGIVRVSPVCGLRPSRAARSLTSNVPKPSSCTCSPFCSAC